MAPDSYPIEAGWAELRDDGSIVSAGMLIKRPSGWTDWSPSSGRIHGITRADLLESGQPAELVVEALEATLGDRLVYSDAPEAEAMWADRLYRHVGLMRRWRIGDAIARMATFVGDQADQDILEQYLGSSRPHRAEADARLLATAYASLRDRWRARRGLGHA